MNDPQRWEVMWRDSGLIVSEAVLRSRCDCRRRCVPGLRFSARSVRRVRSPRNRRTRMVEGSHPVSALISGAVSPSKWLNVITER